MSSFQRLATFAQPILLLQTAVIQSVQPRRAGSICQRQPISEGWSTSSKVRRWVTHASKIRWCSRGVVLGHIFCLIRIHAPSIETLPADIKRGFVTLSCCVRFWVAQVDVEPPPTVVISIADFTPLVEKRYPRARVHHGTRRSIQRAAKD